MPDERTLTATKALPWLRSQTCRRNSARSACVRPVVFGLLGLAVSVFLWGLSYKLSLYHLPRTPSARVSMAKLWTEPRNPGLVPAGVRIRLQANPAAQAAVTRGSERPLMVAAGFVRIRTSLRPILLLAGLLPSRSPPLSFFA